MATLESRFDEDEDFASLSHGQFALWVQHRLAPHSAAYNVMYAAQMTDAVDTSALDRALTRVVHRHPLLRTTYEERGGDVVRRTAPLTGSMLSTRDADDWPARGVVREMWSVADMPFDLRRGPVWRAVAFVRGSHGATLLFVVHHIAADSWAVRLIVDEWVAAYGRELAGRFAGSEPPDRSYARYVRKHRSSVAGAEGRAALAYWREKLAPPVASLELPYDRQRPPVSSFRGEALRMRLAPRTLAAVHELAVRDGSTPFSIYLSAFYLLLAGYAHGSRIAVGSPMSCRLDDEFRRTVGHFANPVVLVADVAPTSTIRAFVRHVQSTVHSAMDHQDYPLGLLTEHLQPRRERGQAPFFHVLFVMESGKSSREQPRDDVGESIGFYTLAAEQRGAAYDVTLTVVLNPRGSFFRLQFDSQLFDRSTARGLARRYRAVLESMLDAPDQSIEECSASPADARAPRLSLTRAFAASARAAADGMALECGGSSVTYAELNRRANAIARKLRSQAVTRGCRVGLLLGRSPELVAAILGILKAGAAYVPLDPAHPPARLAHVLADAGASVLLSERALASRRASISIRTIDVEDIEPAESESDCDEARPSDPAYLMYTSGSSGAPKGVVVSHAAVMDRLEALRERLAIAPEHVFLASTTVSFDISALEVFLPLLLGGRIVMTNDDVTKDPRLVVELLRTTQLDVVQATPTVWRLLLRAGLRGPTKLKLLCGGEPLSRELADELLMVSGDAWNLYGPTETTIWATAERLTSGSEPIAIGRALDGVRIVVVDDALRCVSTGALGEICIGGRGLASGYHGLPELTHDRFVDGLPADGHDGLWYRTGDIGRVLADGRIECRGRMDRQIKLHGQRIELAEIESALRRQPGVADAAVVHRVEGADERLDAFVECTPDSHWTSGDLRARLTEWLPQLMIPSIITFTDQLPRNIAGKIDLGALSPSRAAHADPIGVRPSTELERTLADIVQTVLRIPTVGVHESLFDLGAHSIQSLQIVELAAQRGVRMRPEMVFEHPTIAALASALERDADA